MIHFYFKTLINNSRLEAGTRKGRNGLSQGLYHFQALFLLEETIMAKIEINDIVLAEFKSLRERGGSSTKTINEAIEGLIKGVCKEFDVRSALLEEGEIQIKPSVLGIFKNIVKELTPEKGISEAIEDMIIGFSEFYIRDKQPDITPTLCR